MNDYRINTRALIAPGILWAAGLLLVAIFAPKTVYMNGMVMLGFLVLCIATFWALYALYKEFDKTGKDWPMFLDMLFPEYPVRFQIGQSGDDFSPEFLSSLILGKSLQFSYKKHYLAFSVLAGLFIIIHQQPFIAALAEISVTDMRNTAVVFHFDPAGFAVNDSGLWRQFYLLRKRGYRLRYYTSGDNVRRMRRRIRLYGICRGNSCSRSAPR